MVVDRELRDLVYSVGHNLLISIFCPLSQDTLCALIPAHKNGRELEVLDSRRGYPCVLATVGFGELPTASIATAVAAAATGGLDRREYRWKE